MKNDETTKIKIGKLGRLDFKKGYYVYVGSAMNGLESRLKRHLSNKKKMHWHVDYLLKKSEITDIIYNESEKKIECELSQHISSKTSNIEGFGCSDCECDSHLYYFKIELPPTFKKLGILDFLTYPLLSGMLIFSSRYPR
ncbi:DUF123 domain-containing protein, partial [uncultured Methanobrevibacter sp.]|uniref:GIY-YIG nuclease family protein n=1 Tax=uncultured Methanobrevibacter sp. TaxID=253161 RepID=UPI0037446118